MSQLKDFLSQDASLNKITLFLLALRSSGSTARYPLSKEKKSGNKRERT